MAPAPHRLRAAVYSFRMHGDSMVGMAHGFTDVIQMSFDTAKAPMGRVFAHRVAVPGDPVFRVSGA